jgi:mannonate dehydratase
MKLGLGMSHNLIKRDNFQFAKQMGCTDLVLHLTDYTQKTANIQQSREMYTYDSLMRLKKAINDEGLEFHAIENFCPADWSDILLDGPRKIEQMENIKKIIRDVGKADIPIFGYNFSIAGVWGRELMPVARGRAETPVFNNPKQDPIPNGMVWNYVYNSDLSEGTVGTITNEQLWNRLEYFLEEIIPVAEEAGVIMAAHPDDPPMSEIRGTARLVYQPHLYQKLLDIAPSSNNALEFCLGSLQEMTEGSIYDAIDQYCNHIGYVHFRNVRGKVPHYQEVFIDEGDIDMIQALRHLKQGNYQGVLIPDHTPSATCDAPWHAGMAFALGYMRAALSMLEQES